MQITHFLRKQSTISWRLIVLLLILNGGCTTGDQETVSESSDTRDTLDGYMPDYDTDSVNSDIPDPAPPPQIRFICRDIGQNMDNPLYEVSLLVGSSYYTLDTIHTCESILYTDFEEFEIPSSAISAAGGWWKNAGDYFYVMEEYGEVVVMHAWQTEEQSTQGYFYKEKRRIMLPQPKPVTDL